MGLAFFNKYHYFEIVENIRTNHRMLIIIILITIIIIVIIIVFIIIIIIIIGLLKTRGVILVRNVKMSY